MAGVKTGQGMCSCQLCAPVSIQHACVICSEQQACSGTIVEQIWVLHLSKQRVTDVQSHGKSMSYMSFLV